MVLVQLILIQKVAAAAILFSIPLLLQEAEGLALVVQQFGGACLEGQAVVVGTLAQEGLEQAEREILAAMGVLLAAQVVVEVELVLRVKTHQHLQYMVVMVVQELLPALPESLLLERAAGVAD